MQRYSTLLRAHPAFLILIGSVFFVFALLLFLFSFPHQHAAAESPPASAPAVAAGTSIRPLEIHIANDGLVLLRSARISAIDGNTLTVSTAWGSADFTWIVHVDPSRYGTHNFGTVFLNSDGTQGSVADIHVGNTVTVTGMLDNAAQEPTLKADSVRVLN